MPSSASASATSSPIRIARRLSSSSREAAARPRQDQARRRIDVPVGLRRRQGSRRRTVHADARRLRLRSDRVQEVPEADRLQRHSADRRVPGRRLHQGRVEDGRRDQEILDPKIKLVATCVRVPVFIGHSEAVAVEFENEITADEARDILREAPGCLVIDKREPGRLHHARSRPPARTPPTSAASARTRRSNTA